MTGMAPSLKAHKAVGLQVLGMQVYRRAYTIWNFTSYQLPIIIRGAFLSRRRSIARQKARKKLSSKVLDGQPCASHRYLGETFRKLACVFLSRFFSFLYICALHLDEITSRVHSFSYLPRDNLTDLHRWQPYTRQNNKSALNILIK